MASSQVVFVAVLVCLATVVAGERCPSFTNAKSSCTSNTCGHFVYKGSFVDAVSSKHILAPFESGIKLTPATGTPAACCNQCRNAEVCAYWSYNAVTGMCLLYGQDLCHDAKTGEASAESVSGNNGAYDPKTADSYVGGFCLETPTKEAVVASSEEPKALPEKAFCLVSDKELHINMLLGGYFDPRTTGAATVRKGMAVRTWIREVGIMWTAKGQTHTLHVGARRGPEQERQEGYLDFIRVDGMAVPKLTLGDELNLFDGQAVVSFEAYEKTGPYDVDVYKVKVEGLLEAEMRLRIAHPLLQLESDAEVHVNMDILDLEYTNMVHGVLGQTYRADRLDQALNYAALSDLMFGSSSEGEANTIDSLDGTVNSYVSSSVTAPDCAFTQFTPVKRALEVASEGAAKSAEAVEKAELAATDVAVASA